MSVIRWDPYAEVDSIISRPVPSSFAKWPRFALEGNGAGIEWTPSADISETESEYLIRTELPGVRKEDVQVTFDDGVITIKGERRQQREDKTEKFHRLESSYGSFERRFALPDHVTADLIRCETKDGVLTVRVPKADTVKSKPRQITLQ